jgi:dipeptidyl aminopeptidase/acylaminoacyl peptidase
VSGDGAQVVFDSIEDGQEDLFVVKTDGTGLRRITDDGFKDRAPRWSPDGRRILFLSDRSGRYEAWTVNPDGSGLEQVSVTEADRQAQAPIWSPDGTRALVNLQQGPPVIVDLRVPWSQQSRVVAAPPDDPDVSYFGWSWSPDGRSLAGERGPGLVTYSLDARILSAGPPGARPMWLADSRRLLYMDRQKIYLLDTVTKRIKEVYTAAPNQIQSIGLSPGARSIAISVAINEADIWLASLR